MLQTQVRKITFSIESEVEKEPFTVVGINSSENLHEFATEIIAPTGNPTDSPSDDD